MFYSFIALLHIVFMMGLGYAAGLQTQFFDANWLHQQGWYPYMLYLFLGIGIYASVASIDLKKMSRDLPLVTRVVSFGVVLKILVIGGILYLLTGDLTAFVFGVIMAQIDPLSVSALSNKISQLSQRARNILLVWSSFDDPVTIIMASLIGMMVFSIHNIADLSPIHLVFINVIVPIVAYVLFKLRRAGGQSLDALIALSAFDMVLLVCVFMVSIAFGLILSVALVALFLRPTNHRVIDVTVWVSYTLALFLLGTHLQGGLNFYFGGLLALAAILSQFVIAWFFTRNVEAKDRYSLCFSQQNGITTVILALLFAPYMPDVVAIVTSAILLVNLFHILALFGLSRILFKSI